MRTSSPSWLALILCAHLRCATPFKKRKRLQGFGVGKSRAEKTVRVPILFIKNLRIIKLYGFARIYRISVYLSLRTHWTLRTYRLGTTLLLVPEVRRGIGHTETTENTEWTPSIPLLRGKTGGSRIKAHGKHGKHRITAGPLFSVSSVSSCVI